MHLLVVGGNGFIGSHCVAAAVDAGHQVSVVGRTTHAPAFPHKRSFSFLAGGVEALCENHALLERADIVLHMATASKPSSTNADPRRDRDQALRQISTLMQAMQAVGTDRLVYLSSGGAVYGNPQVLPIPEEHPLQPLGVYGQIKRAVEQAIIERAERSNLKALVVRPSNPYGPGQGASEGFAVIPTFLRAVRTHQPVTLFGDGTATRDYIHVADVARFLLMAIAGQHTGTFNVGSGQGTSLLALLAIIEQAAGQTAVRDHRPARAFDPQQIVLDILKAETTMGWRPCITLRDGLMRYAQATP